MNPWNQILQQLEPPHHVWFQDTSFHVSSDTKTAIVVCATQEQVNFLSQLYFLTMIYPLIKQVMPTVHHLRVVHGSIYDLVKGGDAVIVSFL